MIALTRTLGRLLWTSLVCAGLSAYGIPTDLWSPTRPERHPERLTPDVLPDATEQALWDQLADLHLPASEREPL